MLWRVIRVPWNAVYLCCDHANVLCIFICLLNHEVLTDKLSHLLFGPVRGGAGSGLEQWGLCVRCPQDSKHCSSVPGSRSWGFKVCIKRSLKRISPVCCWEFVSQWVLQPHSGTTWAHLMFVCASVWVCVYVRACFCVCEACVSHQSSSDPRALMWNPFNPCAHSVVGWCGGRSPSTAQ